MKNNWQRKCSGCENVIFYKSAAGYNKANRLNTKCRNCTHNVKIEFLNKTRICPNCNKSVKYKLPSKCAVAEKNNYFCSECFRNKRKWSRESTDWIRTCSNCDKIIQYKSLKTYQSATYNNSVCRECVYKKLKLPPIKTIRNCPNCNKEIFYTDKYAFLRAEKEGKKCKSCISTKYKKDEIYKRICVNCGNEVTYSSRYSYKSAILKNPKYCKKCRPDTFLFNPIACEYINKLNLENGWNLKHGMNGGEVKITNGMFYYSVDGYDKNKNIVVEYDEPHHYGSDGKLKDEDVIRQNNIISHLGCRFYRYNEKKKLLYEVSLTTN